MADRISRNTLTETTEATPEPLRWEDGSERYAPAAQIAEAAQHYIEMVVMDRSIGNLMELHADATAALAYLDDKRAQLAQLRAFIVDGLRYHAEKLDPSLASEAGAARAR